MKILELNSLRPVLGIQKTQKTFVSTPQLVNKADSVSFSARYISKPVNVDVETAEFVANSLSTSTSGHRAPYGSDKFNPDVVELMTVGVAKYAKDVAKGQNRRPQVLIGGDTRVATRESLPLIENVLLSQGVDVLHIKKPVPTPVLALAAKDNDVDVAILMTASHNPWQDGGYNLVTKEAAIAPAEVTQKVAKKIVETAKVGSYAIDKGSKATSKTFFPYQEYKTKLNEGGLINWEKIEDADIDIYYDALNGTGSNILPRLLEDYDIDMTEIRSKGQEGPNPTAKNLTKLSKELKESDARLKVGLATDGDADRFGIVDENGNFIPANDVILMAAYHLAKNKGLEGALIRSQATCSQLDAVGELYNQQVIETPVGFKFIGEDILDLRKEGKDILVAGEESGGMTAYGHIPEKDGVLANLLILDLIATEKKPVSQILADVKKELNINLVAENFNKKLSSESDKNIIMSRMENIYNEAVNKGNEPFGYDFLVDIEKTQQNATEMRRYKKSGDGVKIIFMDGSNVLVRKSGTEPLVKCYIEASGDNIQEANAKKAALKKQMEEIFTI